MRNVFKTLYPSHVFAFVIILLGVALRFVGYAQFPVLGETKDEFAWTFLGSSLLETGIPNSWSHFSAYTPFTTLTIGFDQFPMVQPALDHPPLFSLIPGAMHLLTSDNWLSAPSIKAIRFPMIMLGGLNIALMYLVASLFFDKKSKALLATLFYATVPTIVFSSRLVVAENLLVTWTLLSVLFIQLNLNKNVRLLALTIVGIMSVVTKFSGVVVPLTVLLYGFLNKDKMVIKAGVLGAVTGIMLFMFYGLWFDWNLFTQIFFSQSGRDIGLATLINRFFLHPTIVSHIFLDGWIIVGLLSLVHFFTLTAEKKRNTQLLQFIKVTILLQLTFIATAVGEETIHGWYAYTLFPLLMLAIVALIDSPKKIIWVFPLIWVFFLPTIRTGFSYTVGLPSVFLTRGIIGVGFLPLLASIFKNGEKIQKYIFIGIIGAVILANIATILNISDIKYWQDDEYFLPSRVVK